VNGLVMPTVTALCFQTPWTRNGRASCKRAISL
jgi:hypothetical protein